MPRLRDLIPRQTQGNGAMREHRKKIWIDSFQTGLLVRIVVFVFAYQVVAWAFFALCEQINTAFADMGIQSSFLKSALVRNLLALLILIPPLILDALRFAHRLVGPLYRFRKTVQAIAAGERVGLVQLRDGDMLMDFRDDFNAMLKHLEQQGYVLLKTAESAPRTTEAPRAVPDMTPAASHPGA
jgi:nitrogen fixation/metabolism regulation signal transduction histidine kinase